MKGLPAVARLEAHALAAHPFQGLEAATDQDVGQLGVAAVVGHPAHVVEELVGAIAAEIDVAFFVVGQVIKLGEIVDAVENHPHCACGIGAVAAALSLRRRLQHGDRRPLLVRRQRRAGRGIARTDHEYIDLEIVHLALPLPTHTINRG